MAATKGSAEIVRLLAKFGANINYNQAGARPTSLILAAQEGHEEVVDLLLILGAEKEAKGNDKKTALMWASKRNRISVVIRLLASGCDVNAVDRENTSALIHATIEGNLQIISLLLEHGAEINLQDSWKRTALMWACSKGNSEAVRILLHHRADPLITNNEGLNASDLSFDFPETRSLVCGLFSVYLSVTSSREWKEKGDRKDLTSN